MKLFISQPMKGKTKIEIEEVRAQAFKEVKEMFPREKMVLIDSIIKQDPPNDVNRDIWYLGQSILLLAKADVAYFAKGWRDAKGCIEENLCASSYNLITIETN